MQNGSWAQGAAPTGRGAGYRRVVAQAALDARNARFRPDYVAKAEAAEAAASAAAGGSGGQDAWDRQRSAAIERLEQAEKVAGSVAKRLPGAVQKVSRCFWLLMVADGGHSQCTSSRACSEHAGIYFDKSGLVPVEDELAVLLLHAAKVSQNV